MGELHQQNKPDQDRICQKAMKKLDDCAKKYKGSIIWPKTGCDGLAQKIGFGELGDENKNHSFMLSMPHIGCLPGRNFTHLRGRQPYLPEPGNSIPWLGIPASHS